MREYSIYAAILLLALPTCAFAQQPTTQPIEPHKLVLMHYMPWYQTKKISGQWGSHWTGPAKDHSPETTDANGLPDIWSHYHPLIGPYDSTDPAVLDCHLLQMKLAGVDGVIVDWYGISDAADYPAIHKATCAMFNATRRIGMQFCVCFEDRTIQYLVDQKKITSGDVSQFLTDTLTWMQTNWFGSPNYTRLNGRPLILDFGPIYVTEPEPWDKALQSLPVRPELFALHHLWHKINADGGFTWVHPDEMKSEGGLAARQSRLSTTYHRVSTDPNRVIVSAFPGFDDIYQKSLGKLDFRQGDTLRQTLNVAFQGPWPVIQLVTWNDYGEGTMIEPTHEFGYTFLELVQMFRRNEVGPTHFTHTTEDLRLPAELLALRSRQLPPMTEDLNNIQTLLVHGETNTARQKIAQLQP